jgi:hypothetical protein
VSSIVENERKTIQCDNINFFLYFLFCTHEKIILRIPLESENKLKIIRQILRALLSIAIWQQVWERICRIIFNLFSLSCDVITENFGYCTVEAFKSPKNLN